MKTRKTDAEKALKRLSDETTIYNRSQHSFTKGSWFYVDSVSHSACELIKCDDSNSSNDD